MVIQLAHSQSENPMAQTANSQPPQTSHVESDQTTSARLRKLPTQLNTWNRFALVRVSPNASDIQRLGRCVPAFILLGTVQFPAINNTGRPNPSCWASATHKRTSKQPNSKRCKAVITLKEKTIRLGSMFRITDPDQWKNAQIGPIPILRSGASNNHKCDVITSYSLPARPQLTDFTLSK